MADRIVFVCTIILASLYLHGASKIQSIAFGDPMGPRAFPYLIGIGLLCAAGLILKEFLQSGAGKSQNKPVEEKKQDLRHLVVIGSVIVWTIAYFAFFDTLGYIIATAIYLFALMAYFNQRKWTVNGLTSVLFSICSYLLFCRILGITLPKGLLKIFHF